MNATKKPEIQNQNAALPQPLVQLEAERFREPEREAGDVTEHSTADDHVMEVRDHEQAVVQNEVSTRDSQQYAGHATDGEGHHEAQGPHDLAR